MKERKNDSHERCLSISLHDMRGKEGSHHIPSHRSFMMILVIVIHSRQTRIFHDIRIFVGKELPSQCIHLMKSLSSQLKQKSNEKEMQYLGTK
jgi:hypothetical protein